MASMDVENLVESGQTRIVRWLEDPKAFAQFSNAVDFAVESGGRVLLANADANSVLSVKVDGSAAGGATIAYGTAVSSGDCSDRTPWTDSFGKDSHFSVQGDAIIFVDSSGSSRSVKLKRRNGAVENLTASSAHQTFDVLLSDSVQGLNLIRHGLICGTKDLEKEMEKHEDRLVEIWRLDPAGVDPLLHGYLSTKRLHKLANACAKTVGKEPRLTLHGKFPMLRCLGALNRTCMLNDTQLLFGPFAFEPHTAPSFNKDIYGLNNRAYFDALFASWYDLYNRPTPPRVLVDFFTELKTVLQGAKHKDKGAVNSQAEKLAPLPNDDSLFFRRVLLPPDLNKTQEYIFACPMEDLISHMQYVRSLPDEFVSDARVLLQLRLQHDYTALQLVQFLADPKAAPFDAKPLTSEIVGAICSELIEPKQLRLVLAPLYRSNPDDYARILSEIVRTRHSMRSNKQHKETQLQDLRPVLLSNLCDWDMRVSMVSVSFKAMRPDCELIVRGARVRTFSFWLRGAWKFFAKFWDENQLDCQEQENLPELEGTSTQTPRKVPSFDLGSMLTVRGVTLLMHYFFTGDPQITRFVDAYLLLAHAQELMFVDEKGKAFPEHETLIWQLQFAIGTSLGPTAEECLEALSAAVEMQDEELWRSAFPVAKKAYSSVIDSDSGNQLRRDHPYAYDMLLWAVLNDEDLEHIPAP